MRIALWNHHPNRRSTAFSAIGALRKKHLDWFRENLTELFDMVIYVTAL